MTRAVRSLGQLPRARYCDFLSSESHRPLRLFPSAGIPYRFLVGPSFFCFTIASHFPYYGNACHNLRRQLLRHKVQVLDRALAALAILANSSSDCSLAELCPALKLHKSTVHRLMMVLGTPASREEPGNGAISFRAEAYELDPSDDGLTFADARGLSRPLAATIREDGFLLCSYDGQVFYVEKVDHNRACARRAPWEAARQVFYGGSGKACLPSLRRRGERHRTPLGLKASPRIESQLPLH